MWIPTYMFVHGKTLIRIGELKLSKAFLEILRGRHFFLYICTVGYIFFKNMWFQNIQAMLWRIFHDGDWIWHHDKWKLCDILLWISQILHLFCYLCLGFSSVQYLADNRPSKYLMTDYSCTILSFGWASGAIVFWIPMRVLTYLIWLYYVHLSY